MILISPLNDCIINRRIVTTLQLFGVINLGENSIEQRLLAIQTGLTQPSSSQILTHSNSCIVIKFL